MKKITASQIIESILFASDQPVTIDVLSKITKIKSKKKIKEMLIQLNQFYEETERVFRIEEIADGYQLRTKKEFNSWLHQSKVKKAFHLSISATETLSIIAYKQPLTRAEIEYIRSVDSSYVVRSLLNLGLVKITGKSEKAGRPLLYGTTKAFLEVFGLKSLADLPMPEELDFEIEGV